MLRGFRWQLFALFISLIVFAIVLIMQSGSDSDTAPLNIPNSITPSPVIEEQFPAPSPEVVNATPTNEASGIGVAADTQAIEVIQRSNDGIATYREAVIGSVQRLNPLFANLNPVDDDISSLIFEGLMSINEYGEPEPALAEDVVVSFDQLEYVVSLRNDILWQDGTPFNVDDVLFTIAMLSDADFMGDSELGAFWQTVEAERLGDYMLRFRLTQPLSSFLEALRIGILPEHVLRGTPPSQLVSHPFNLDPIGTGPYQLEEIFVSSGQVTAVNLRASPTYISRNNVDNNALGVERIRFQIYDTFDAVVSDLEMRNVDGFAARSRNERATLLNLVARTTDISVITSVEPTVGIIMFNWASEDMPIFNDRRMRQALQLGLERRAIVERHLLNSAVTAESPLPLNSWAYTDAISLPQVDLSLARELIQRVRLPERESDNVDGEAQVEETADTPRLTFSLMTPDEPALINLAQDIATQWTQIDPENLLVQVEALPIDIYLSRLESGDFHTALVELSKNGNADPDVYTFWHQGQYPDGQNYGGANDRRTSELLERGRRDWNGTNRVEIYREFQQEFVNSAVAIPLYYPLFTYVFPSDVTDVQLGFLASPSDRFQTIASWNVR